VETSVVRARSAELRALGEELSLRFRSSFEGRHLDAVVLAPRADGRLRALTGNYIEVSLDPGSAARGEVVRVRVERATRDGTRAHVEGEPDWARRTPDRVPA
jgi:tRNA A37 methylthiotransferase MiaB